MSSLFLLIYRKPRDWVVDYTFIIWDKEGEIEVGGTGHEISMSRDKVINKSSR